VTLPQIIARNQVQKIPFTSITGRVVIQPNTWYTCPTGKKAVVKGRLQCTGLGAAANVDFNAAGILMFRWNNTDTPIAAEDYINSPQSLSAGSDQFAFFDIELAAGEAITTTQNTGTNGEINLFGSVQETPA